MLNWIRDHWKAEPSPSARVPEIIDAVSRHVQDQVFAFTGGPVTPVPAYGSMTDLDWCIHLGPPGELYPSHPG